MKPEGPGEPATLPPDISNKLTIRRPLAPANVEIDDGEQAVGREELVDPVDHGVDVWHHGERVG